MAFALVEKYSNNECPSSANPNQYPTGSTSRKQIISTECVSSVIVEHSGTTSRGQIINTTTASKWVMQSINENLNESISNAMIKSSNIKNVRTDNSRQL